ncbi:phosphate ABC transporter substrate-binding protein PstS [Cyanobacterium sp. IPPAS B-1200]|uniref:phosphate ABC transporter substrate-binding protein PstS n=1 Tax=Cyanobacterium sp. IPPAS B-1200 TaxID=1562720 RepID=UPI0008525216|nr:phosphate ABC transporter substrate-binding protein PstS [Cyanobacterium sp. IPPAS B-1200]OEJ79629.1 phosphate ABC transporter substrate-binding protein PstS [Cyanobacterium sp. IPPAS B-1200]
MLTKLNSKTLKNRVLGGFSSLTLAFVLAACGGESTTTTPTEGEGGGETTTGQTSSIELPFDDNVALTGAGASFPAAIYQNWFVSLNEQVPQLQVNYQSVGSGAGIEQFTAGTVDFGASDVAMTDEQIAEIDRGVLLLPVTAGGIVFAFNVPGVEELNLSREVYVDIALGRITRWNDPRIAADNPDAELPDLAITFVHRSDGSGTTGVLTKHLEAISEDWANEVGSGTTVEWGSAGGSFIGSRGNEGVTASIMQTEGGIGYIEYGYALNNNIPMASLQNASGEFVFPTEETTSATLGNVELPDNLRAFILDPEGANSYPIVTYTWIMAYQQYDDPQKAVALEAAIQYALTEGQNVATELGYIPLPPNVAARVAEAADQLTDEFTITVD